MITGKVVWKPLLQKLVAGQAKPFRLVRDLPEWPSSLSGFGVYLHVPFCRTLCPYCPYNRVEYTDELFAIYERAVKQEIDIYSSRFSDGAASSLYIGGGTPTINWRGLVSILEHLRKRLGDVGDVCIELHPNNMDDECLSALKENGVTMLSIGVESTSDERLTRIKRSHDSRVGTTAVQRALAMGFAAVNVDLMFALPGQTVEEWTTDVESVLALGVDQVSTYPLFTFPHSAFGVAKHLTKVSRPPHRILRAMLESTDHLCEGAGLHRCSVWSWLRPERKKYSSAARHRYIGFGPGAVSMTGNDFYANTFDVKAYASRLPDHRPVAVSMAMHRRLEMAYWLYWRIYELSIRSDDFRRLFGQNASLDAEFGRLLRPLVWTGLLERTADGYVVTKPGAYWIHLLQNEYTLNYIYHLWGECRKQPWPEEVRL